MAFDFGTFGGHRPRKLVEQMDDHYTEHSANVVKKLKLEGWPTE